MSPQQNNDVDTDDMPDGLTPTEKIAAGMMLWLLLALVLSIGLFIIGSYKAAFFRPYLQPLAATLAVLDATEQNQQQAARLATDLAVKAASSPAALCGLLPCAK